ncbi:CHC2 zinc finger domain-containing protein [Roseburia hominis]
MNVFEAVKQSVTIRQAAEQYGIRVSRNGMCVCPFHKDKNPSMKVDRRFHCFGCQADGDVIDFVARLYGLPVKEAALRLAQDFSIPYEDRELPVRRRAKPPPRKETPEQQFKRMERYCFRVLSDYYHLLSRWEKEFAPQAPGEERNPLFTEALQRKSHVGYLLDVLLSADLGERASLIIEYGKEVRNLERRMAELAAGGTAGRDRHHKRSVAVQER